MPMGSFIGLHQLVFCNFNVRKIISFDVANETRSSLERPICGEVISNFKLGVMGSDISLINTCRLGDALLLMSGFSTIFQNLDIKLTSPQNGKLQASPCFICYIKRNDDAHIVIMKT
ncbi:hypothetical protein H5410_025582, partial [Solanum commersonii]